MLAKTITAAAFATLLTLTSAFAGDQDFKLVNKTGYEIKSVFVSSTGNRSWGSDILGRDTLDDGDTVNISFSRRESECRWDLMVVYDDGDKATWGDLNLCSISRVTIFWDRKNQVSRATVD